MNQTSGSENQIGRSPFVYFIGYIAIAVAIIVGFSIAGFDGAAHWALYLSVIGLVLLGCLMAAGIMMPLYSAVLFIPLFFNQQIGLAFLPDSPSEPISTEVLDVETLSGFLGLSRTYRVKTPDGIFEVKSDVFAPGQAVTAGLLRTQDGLAEVEVVCSSNQCFEAVNR